jgi:Uma2 family endonuclease
MDAVKTLSEEALLALATTIKRFEVVNGELRVYPPMGEQAGRAKSNLIYGLGKFVSVGGIGQVYPSVGYVVEGSPKAVIRLLGPDITFVHAAKVQSTVGYLYYSPDLAIDFIRESESYSEIRKKVDDYLSYGVQEVWVVIPDLQLVDIFFADGTGVTFRVGQTIQASRVLAGLALAVNDIF